MCSWECAVDFDWMVNQALRFTRSLCYCSSMRCWCRSRKCASSLLPPKCKDLNLGMTELCVCLLKRECSCLSFCAKKYFAQHEPCFHLMSLTVGGKSSASFLYCDNQERLLRLCLPSHSRVWISSVRCSSIYFLCGMQVFTSSLISPRKSNHSSAYIIYSMCVHVFGMYMRHHYTHIWEAVLKQFPS